MPKLPPKVRNLEGNVYGHLTAQKFIELGTEGAVWECLCACGNRTKVRASDLKSGNTKSCGCQRLRFIGDSTAKHGATRGLHHKEYPKTYKIWRGILNRCYTPSCSSYHNYGGRGIKVCDEWRDSYEAFARDMGECPDGHSVERLDVNGDYSPDNCVWIPLKDQARNRRASVVVELDGERMLQADAARRLGVHPATICMWRKGRREKPKHINLIFPRS